MSRHSTSTSTKLLDSIYSTHKLQPHNRAFMHKNKQICSHKNKFLVTNHHTSSTFCWYSHVTFSDRGRHLPKAVFHTYLVNWPIILSFVASSISQKL